MAETRRPELSSVFDDMLAQNKQRFDDLYRGARPAAATPAAPAAAPPAAPAPSGFDREQSVTARRLTERFGNEWRFEILSRQRDGDEAIVLVKLTVGKEGTVRTQFGRGKFPGGPVSGASDGVRFRLEVASTAQDEARAFRRATEAALKNCADLL
ncbi:MAG TPA: hypothetical protein VET85_03110 [Stellaceae bacterium]|nr:hypothetical protein [Stellaceae bacterium]